MVRQRRSPLRTLSGQLLIMQLGIVLIVLVAVGSVALAQAASEFNRTELRRTTGLAERIAASPLVRTRLEQHLTFGAVGMTEVATLADSVAAVSGGSTAVVVDSEGYVVAATDGRQRGRIAESILPGGSDGSGWSGEVRIAGEDTITSVAPVLSDDDDRLGEVIGAVIVTVRVPSLSSTMLGASSYLLIYLGIASLIGVIGSWLIAQRIKRQTLGLEPREIASLAEYREAVLGGIAEGVIALDPQHRITMINEVGQELLDLGPDAIGRRLEDLGLSSRMCDVLIGTGTGRDQVVFRRDRILVMNRTEVTKEGRHLGSVTTLRDRTELAALERELGAFESTTELLRAQAHEFDNRLHTISGLIQIGDHDKVVEYVSALSEQRAHLDFSVRNRLRDAPVAALVLAKASTAAERRVQLVVSEKSSLDQLSPTEGADVATVVGNLVDNAVDAASGSGPEPWVELDITQRGREIVISVCDSGPGVTPELAAEVFTHGFTTKAATAGERGIGLALTRRLCRRRNGDVSIIGTGTKASFVARLEASGI